MHCGRHRDAIGSSRSRRSTARRGRPGGTARSRHRCAPTVTRCRRPRSSGHYAIAGYCCRRDFARTVSRGRRCGARCSGHRRPDEMWYGRGHDALKCLQLAVAEAEHVLGLNDLRTDRRLAEVFGPHGESAGMAPAPIAASSPTVRPWTWKYTASASSTTPSVHIKHSETEHPRAPTATSNLAENTRYAAIRGVARKFRGQAANQLVRVIRSTGIRRRVLASNSAKPGWTVMAFASSRVRSSPSVGVASAR
ncbi:Uncharacterised protein [Nocardia brasiliensis]|nr:Uncharacterised protein [Nocardia brasiliensis]